MNQPDHASEPFARRCTIAGALLMLVGLVLGAAGTHVLAQRLTPQQLSSYETAVLYGMLHSIGLVLVGLIAGTTGATAWLRWSARLMALGILLFCGSIWVVTAGAPRSLLTLAPAGGFALMLSWVLLALHASKRR